jgi:hypothetical protein
MLLGARTAAATAVATAAAATAATSTEERLNVYSCTDVSIHL